MTFFDVKSTSCVLIPPSTFSSGGYPEDPTMWCCSSWMLSLANHSCSLASSLSVSFSSWRRRSSWNWTNIKITKIQIPSLHKCRYPDLPLELFLVPAASVFQSASAVLARLPIFVVDSHYLYHGIISMVVYLSDGSFINRYEGRGKLHSPEYVWNKSSLPIHSVVHPFSSISKSTSWKF